MFSSLCQDREDCFMSGTTATVLSIIVHRNCFCCISEQQCSMDCLVSVDFKHCSSPGDLVIFPQLWPTEQF